MLLLNPFSVPAFVLFLNCSVLTSVFNCPRGGRPGAGGHSFLGFYNICRGCGATCPCRLARLGPRRGLPGPGCDGGVGVDVVVHAHAVGEIVVLFDGYQVGGVALHTSACPNELCLAPLSASASSPSLNWVALPPVLDCTCGSSCRSGLRPGGCNFCHCFTG